MMVVNGLRSACDFSLLRSFSALEVIRISVEFRPRRNLAQKAWIGAAVRNRFLYAAEQVMMPCGGTLRESLDHLSLDSDHFLYRQLCGGFPKGYLFDVSEMSQVASEFSLPASGTYRFHVLLVGRLVSFQSYVVSAIQRMLEEGLGNPCVPLDLVSLDVGIPFSMSDFVDPAGQEVELRLRAVTPVALSKPVDEAGSGYLSRLNGFPSFYQWISAAVYRLATLTVLYSDTGLPEIRDKDEWEYRIESLIAPAVRSWLVSADISYVSLRSTPKRGRNNVYVMSGYLGTLTYCRVRSDYIPLLRMMSELSIGNDVNFGLGRYECLLPEYPYFCERNEPEA